MTIVERLQRIGIRRTVAPSRGFRYRAPSGRVSRADRGRIESLRILPSRRGTVRFGRALLELLR